MKNIKYALIMLVCLSFVQTNAFGKNIQESFSRSLEGVKWVKIESNAEIVIKKHNRNELIIRDYDGKVIDKRSLSKQNEDNSTVIVIDRGGKISKQDEDNTKVGFYIAREGDNLVVRNLRELEGKIAVIYLPNTQNITVEGTGSGDIQISGINGEIEVSNSETGGIYIDDVTGPITANSITGDIRISFTKVGQDSPISISSAMGAIEVIIPAKTPANLNLDAALGKISTNFSINKQKKKYMTGGQRIKTEINNGGVEIKVKSSIGNINLRKQ